MNTTATATAITSPFHVFELTNITKFKDGTFGLILTHKNDPNNVLTHTGKKSYLEKLLKERYNILKTL